MICYRSGSFGVCEAVCIKLTNTCVPPVLESKEDNITRSNRRCLDIVLKRTGKPECCIILRHRLFAGLQELPILTKEYHISVKNSRVIQYVHLVSVCVYIHRGIV